MYYKAKEMAKTLNVSTSALRHYEAWGMVPAPEREHNGYRKYTEIHLAYFRVIRAMFPTVGMGFISEVLVAIQKGELDQALWMVTQVQASLYQDKMLAEKTCKVLDSAAPLTEYPVKSKDQLTIGQVAKAADVAPSAIRNWEKQGLIVPIRNPKNGYRIYTTAHLRQVLLIRTLRNATYSIKRTMDIVKAIEQHNTTQAIRVLRESIQKLDHRNRSMIHGVYELYRLCELTGLLNNINSTTARILQT